MWSVLERERRAFDLLAHRLFIHAQERAARVINEWWSFARNNQTQSIAQWIRFRAPTRPHRASPLTTSTVSAHLIAEEFGDKRTQADERREEKMHTYKDDTLQTTK